MNEMYIRTLIIIKIAFFSGVSPKIPLIRKTGKWREGGSGRERLQREVSEGKSQMSTN